MQKKDTLADSPRGSSAEFAATGIALRDAVGQPCSHVVEGEVAERGKAHLALGGKHGLSRCLVRFALDSPLEGDGFEPSVPCQIFLEACRSPGSPFAI